MFPLISELFSGSLPVLELFSGIFAGFEAVLWGCSSVWSCSLVGFLGIFCSLLFSGVNFCAGVKIFSGNFLRRVWSFSLFLCRLGLELFQDSFLRQIRSCFLVTFFIRFGLTFFFGFEALPGLELFSDNFAGLEMLFLGSFLLVFLQGLELFCGNLLCRVWSCSLVISSPGSELLCGNLLRQPWSCGNFFAGLKLLCDNFLCQAWTCSLVFSLPA
ncbi:hypothetical protein C2G38_2041723 [Gigaspora rosea]|uniref:Uncharacterized protein n=1 Tax=Gigaspora rosea TaxID=44941 RepID=A0A397UZD1_9GLOM|nr:hypothetical protein C2G38_2041723 [Gigaspora rosea]